MTSPADTQSPVRPVNHLVQLQRLPPLLLGGRFDERAQRTKRPYVMRHPLRPAISVPSTNRVHSLRRHLLLILAQVLEEVPRCPRRPLAHLTLVPQLHPCEVAKFVQRRADSAQVALLRQQRDAALGGLPLQRLFGVVQAVRCVRVAHAEVRACVVL